MQRVARVCPRQLTDDPRFQYSGSAQVPCVIIVIRWKADIARVSLH